MFGLFKKDPVQKLQNQYEAKLAKAMQAQRNGDIRSFSELTEEATEIQKQIESLQRGD